MNNYIIPIPFQLSPYAFSSKNPYKTIVSTKVASQPIDIYAQSDLINNSLITDPIEFELLPNDQKSVGWYLRSALSMQENTAQLIESIWSDTKRLCVIGGDHSVSIGTGAGLARVTDLSRVGLVWIDAHADCNTDETSISKSITGYPLAVASGLGPSQLTDAFGSNFVKKIVHIGLRDCEEEELNNLKKINARIYSPFDIQLKGLSKILTETIKYFKDCDFIWISCDVDSLDGMYFENGETDLPLSGGLTPREILTILHTLGQTKKLKVTELLQLNSIDRPTLLTNWARRFIEISFGLSSYKDGVS